LAAAAAAVAMVTHSRLVWHQTSMCLVVQWLIQLTSIIRV